VSQLADDVGELTSMITSVMGEVCNDLFERKIEWYSFSGDEVDVLSWIGG